MAGARDIRLQSDFEHVSDLVRNSEGSLSIESAHGKPPHTYVFVYRCRGIEGLLDDRPVYRNIHKVQVRLPARYPAPSGAPRARMMTPIWHPHVYPNRDICIGDWHTSEFLDEFVLRIGGLIQYDRRYLNVRDPANEAAVEWAKKNLILLPTDSRAFGGVQVGEAEEAPAPEPVGWQELE